MSVRAQMRFIFIFMCLLLISSCATESTGVIDKRRKVKVYTETHTFLFIPYKITIIEKPNIDGNISLESDCFSNSK